MADASVIRLAGRSYSGRGMFGKQCLAFDSLDVLLAAIRADPTLPVDGWVWDAMGRGFVFYNPAVPPPIGTSINVLKCCAEPMVRGGKCYNCGEWAED